MSARRAAFLALLLLPGATPAAQAAAQTPSQDAPQNAPQAAPQATQQDVPQPAPGNARQGVVAASGSSVQAPEGPLVLGQRIELLVRGPLEPGAYAVLASPPEGVEVGASRLETSFGGPVLHVPLRVTREGDFRLEGLQLVTGERREALAPVELRVELGLPEGRTPRVADALPPVTLPGTPAWVIAAAIGLGALLLALGWLLWRRSRPAAAAPPEVVPAPDVVAAEAFARLRARLPRTADEVPPFVTDVSAVLRTYIEERFGVRAPESTTEEFLSVVAQRHDALASRREALAGFLTRCDLVKFARHRPGPDFVLPLLELAERFVADTRPVSEAADGREAA